MRVLDMIADKLRDDGVDEAELQRRLKIIRIIIREYREDFQVTDFEVTSSILGQLGVQTKDIGVFLHHKDEAVSAAKTRFANKWPRVKIWFDATEHSAYRRQQFQPRLKTEILGRARSAISAKLERRIWPWRKKVPWFCEQLPDGTLRIVPDRKRKLRKIRERIIRGEGTKPAARAEGLPEKVVSAVHWMLQSSLLLGVLKHGDREYRMLDGRIFTSKELEELHSALRGRPKKVRLFALWKRGRQVLDSRAHQVVRLILKLRIQRKDWVHIAAEAAPSADRLGVRLVANSVRKILSDEFYLPAGEKLWRDANVIRRPHPKLEDVAVRNQIQILRQIELGNHTAKEISSVLKSLKLLTVQTHLNKLWKKQYVKRQQVAGPGRTYKYDLADRGNAYLRSTVSERKPSETSVVQT